MISESNGRFCKSLYFLEGNTLSWNRDPAAQPQSQLTARSKTDEEIGYTGKNGLRLQS